MAKNESNEKKNTIIIVAVIAAVVIGLLIIVVLPIVLVFSSFNSAKKDIKEDYSEIMEKAKKEIKNSEEEMKAESFNSKLGITTVDYDGNEVKEIISSIVESNSKNSDHIVTVTYSGSNMSSTQQLNDLITKIDSNKDYTVTKEYDADGYIVKVNIA